MLDYFKQNDYKTGVIAGLGTEVLTGLLIWLGLVIAQEPVMPHLRWFGGIFIPILLILRYYAKKNSYEKTCKALIVTFFLTFLIYIALVLKYIN